MPSKLGLPSHCLRNISGVWQMGYRCARTRIPLQVLDLPGACPEQPYPFNGIVLSKFSGVQPGVKKLPNAACYHYAYFLHIICHSLKSSLGFEN